MFLEQVFNPVENRPTFSKEEINASFDNFYGKGERPLALPDDMSGQYNTQLTPEQETEYKTWAKQQGRERDVENYDLRGAWLELQNGTMTEDERGHIGDKYKKPNHPTFSTESIYNGKDGYQGGVWSRNGNVDVYTPQHKLTPEQAKRLQLYFAQNEEGVALNLKDKVYDNPKLQLAPKSVGAFDGFSKAFFYPIPNVLTRMGSGALMVASKAMPWVRDDFLKQMEQASLDLDKWNRANLGANPETMGKASQVIHGLVGMLAELGLLTTGVGGVGGLAIKGVGAAEKIRKTSIAVGSALFGTDIGISERNRLVAEGVDEETAFNAGLASGLANTIGAAIPPFLGSSRAMSALYGAGSNVALNYAELSTISYILDHQNYAELAKQYELNTVDALVSAGMGAFMGLGFWRNPVDVKYDRAQTRLYERYKSDIDAGGKFKPEESKTQADINSRAVVSLARMAGVSPDKMDEFAAKIEWSDDGKSLSVPKEYAMKIADGIESRYNEAIAKGDMVSAEALVKEYAKARGYTIDENYRDWHHAPRASVAKEDFTNLEKLREATKEAADVNLFAIANGVSIVPDDFFTYDGWRQYSNQNEVADVESFNRIRKAIDSIQNQVKKYGKVKHMPGVWVYRAVPKSVKEGNLQSEGQWVSPSRTYAQQHGQSRFGPGEYRIIKECVPADSLWFNGDSISEWGFDNGEKYVYKNTTNNRKRYDAIVRDYDGNIVPLSKRFNPRKWEEFYQIDKMGLLHKSRALDKQISAWRNGDATEKFDLGEPSWVLQIFGVSKQENLKIFGRNFLHAILKPGESLRREKGKHGLTDEEVRGLLVGIQQPLAVFRSTNRNALDGETSIVILTELTQNGKNIVAPVWLTSRVNGEIIVDNRIPTAYAKKDIRGWIEDGLLLGYEKTKGAKFLSESMGSNSRQLGTSDKGKTPSLRAIIYENETSLGDIYQAAEGDGIRGAFNPSTNTIRLTPNANLSTFSHEHSHWYLTNVMALGGKESPSLELQLQMKAILKAFGLKDIKAWEALGFEGQRKYQEQFAAWTEIYLTQGKSPVKGLEGVFAKMAEWLVGMYKSVLGKDAGPNAAVKEVSDRYQAQFGEKLPELSPEVRKVLDTMYGAQQKRSAFKSTKTQTAAARIVQAQRVNHSKVSAPISDPHGPEAGNVGQAAQGKAVSDLNNGRKVDVSEQVGDTGANVPVVEDTQSTFARGVSIGDGDNSRVVVLQNRNRSDSNSVAQMNSIATDPQYGRLSTSRTTQSGAPIVSFGHLPDKAYQGKSEIITESNGNKVPVTYYVVEADDVMRSNNYDGTPNKEWNNDNPDQMRAIAGNGRMAGLSEAYNRGTAEQYRQDLMADSENHGVSPETIQGMKKPVLVRYMPPERVTTGFVERSNTSDVLVRSSLETAVQDSPKVRKNIDKYEFDEDGDPTKETLGQFLTDVGEVSEMGNLIDSNGNPTTAARNRIKAAVFYEAYRDKRLTELVADSEDKQGIKRILSAMSAFAPHVIQIRESSGGAIDLAPIITDATHRILQARINGEGVDFTAQGDMFSSNPATEMMTNFLSQNRNSAAAMLRVLRPFAAQVENALQAADSPMFADLAVKTDLADAMALFRKAENDEIRSKSGDLLGDAGGKLLPDIDVEAMRASLTNTIEDGKNLVDALVDGVAETNRMATPEAKAEAQQQHLIDQQNAREALSENSEAVRARNFALDDPDRQIVMTDENGNDVAITAREAMEQTLEIDKSLNDDTAGLGMGVACIIRNQGIRKS